MTAAVLYEADICPRCIEAGGLCGREACQRAVLPQLATNRGWLKMIGDVLTEQTERQELTRELKIGQPTTEEAAAVAKIGRRNARRVARQKRGYHGLALAIMAKHRPPALDPKDTRHELNFDHK